MHVVWDGRTDDGLVAPDGLYRMQVGLRRTGRTVVVAGSFNIDTTAPKPVVLSVTPPIAGPVPGAFEIRARGVGRRRAPRFRVLRTDVTPVQEVARFRGRAGSRRGVWDGLVGGAPAPPGTYIVVVSVRDRSGNEGTAPAVLPPVQGQIRGKPGITVRQITAQPPLEPVRAGQRVEFFVDSRRRSYRWSIRRVGHRPRDQEGHRGAGAPAHRPRPAGGVGRVPAAGALRPLQRQRPVPRPGARAGAAAGRGPGHHVARRRQGRRRRRRPAQHARDRRPGEVAARDRRRQGDAGHLRRPDRAAARLPRPRAHPLRPHLRHRAHPLPRPAGDRPRGRDPGRPAALGGALAGAAAARTTSRTAAGWRASAPTACAAGCASGRAA